MMEVNGIGPSMAPKAVESAAPVGGIAPKAEVTRAVDVVEISSIAKLAAKIHELPDVRTELVEHVKTQIAAGEYETPERLEIAIDRLMEDMFRGMQT